MTYSFSVDFNEPELLDPVHQGMVWVFEQQSFKDGKLEIRISIINKGLPQRGEVGCVNFTFTGGFDLSNDKEIRSWNGIRKTVEGRGLHENFDVSMDDWDESKSGEWKVKSVGCKITVNNVDFKPFRAGSYVLDREKTLPETGFDQREAFNEILEFSKAVQRKAEILFPSSNQ